MRGIGSSFGVVTSLISAIGLAVAAIAMFILIYISVLNKKRQIGILRAIGIRGKIIIYSYLFQSLFYAVCGIVFGGLMFGYFIEPYFIRFPLDLPMGLVSLAVQKPAIRDAVWGLLLAAALAGFLPVLSITRQSIIKSIWGG